MSTPRYEMNGTWYKGNTHVHSTASDGGKTFVELADMYGSAGYDFVFRTDHWVVSDVSAEGTGVVSEPDQNSLLWMDGVELHGLDDTGASYHVVCLGAFHGISRPIGLLPAMEMARAQGGLLILAHPHWCGNTWDDALRWGFDGVEIYNHVCHWLNGKGNGLVHWSAMLSRFPNTLGLAVDDAHISPEHPGWNGGWIMVNAPARSREAIWQAIRAGHFYSTCGPEFYSITYDGDIVRVDTSLVQFVRLVGPADRGQRIGSFDGAVVDGATFKVPDGWPYAYIEIEDALGRRAWTNPLFVATP